MPSSPLATASDSTPSLGNFDSGTSPSKSKGKFAVLWASKSIQAFRARRSHSASSHVADDSRSESFIDVGNSKDRNRWKGFRGPFNRSSSEYAYKPRASTASEATSWSTSSATSSVDHLPIQPVVPECESPRSSNSSLEYYQIQPITPPLELIQKKLSEPEIIQEAIVFDQEQFNWVDYLEEYGIPHLTAQDTPPVGDEDGDYVSDDSETLGSIVDQFSLDDASSQKSREKFDKLGDLVIARASVGPPESNTTAPGLLLPRIEITDAESQSAPISPTTSAVPFPFRHSYPLHSPSSSSPSKRQSVYASIIANHLTSSKASQPRPILHRASKSELSVRLHRYPTTVTLGPTLPLVLKRKRPSSPQFDLSGVADSQSLLDTVAPFSMGVEDIHGFEPLRRPPKLEHPKTKKEFESLLTRRVQRLPKLGEVQVEPVGTLGREEWKQRDQARDVVEDLVLPQKETISTPIRTHIIIPSLRAPQARPILSGTGPPAATKTPSSSISSPLIMPSAQDPSSKARPTKRETRKLKKPRPTPNSLLPRSSTSKSSPPGQPSYYTPSGSLLSLRPSLADASPIVPTPSAPSISPSSFSQSEYSVTGMQLPRPRLFSIPSKSSGSNSSPPNRSPSHTPSQSLRSLSHPVQAIPRPVTSAPSFISSQFRVSSRELHSPAFERREMIVTPASSAMSSTSTQEQSRPSTLSRSNTKFHRPSRIGLPKSVAKSLPSSPMVSTTVESRGPTRTLSGPPRRIG